MPLQSTLHCAVFLFVRLSGIKTRQQRSPCVFLLPSRATLSNQSRGAPESIFFDATRQIQIMCQEPRRDFQYLRIQLYVPPTFRYRSDFAIIALLSSLF